MPITWKRKKKETKITVWAATHFCICQFDAEIADKFFDKVLWTFSKTVFPTGLSGFKKVYITQYHCSARSSPFFHFSPSIPSLFELSLLLHSLCLFPLLTILETLKPTLWSRREASFTMLQNPSIRLISEGQPKAWSIVQASNTQLCVQKRLWWMNK